MGLMRYFLIEAQHSPTVYEGVPLRRGQLLRGRSRIVADTGLSEKQVRNGVKRLSSLGEVQAEPSGGAKSAIVYTVANYDIYDAMKGEGAKQDDVSGPSEGPKRGQRGAIYKKGLRKEQKATTPISEVEPYPVSTPVSSVDVGEGKDGKVTATPPTLDSGVIADLTAYGIDPDTARSLFESHTEADIRDVIARVRAMGNKARNPAGFILKAIQEGWALPNTEHQTAVNDKAQKSGACPGCGEKSWKGNARREYVNEKTIVLSCNCGYRVKQAWG